MLEVIKNAVWSPVTAVNLLLIGIVIMIKTRFKTLIDLPGIFKDTVFKISKNRKAFSLMCTSLGGTIGVGNAVGIVGAITEGGAGAVFWMAVAGIIGMAIKYYEVYLSMVYTSPIKYIEAIGSRVMASVFSVLCICVSFGMGNMAQMRAAVSISYGIIPIKSCIFTLIAALLFFYITKQGIDNIRKFSEIAVPLVSVLYVIMLTVVIIKRKEYIPDAFSSITNESGIITGIKWSLIKGGITSGFSKAIFSSEAGLGCSGFTHNKSDISPYEQAKWAVVEVFIDTFICIMTSIALLTFSDILYSVPASCATKSLFYLNFGKGGELFYAISMTLFAFASLVCWYYNGSQAVVYLSSKSGVSRAYLMVFAFLVFMSAFIGDNAVLALSDIANGIMLTVNVCALWILVFNNKLTF